MDLSSNTVRQAVLALSALALASSLYAMKLAIELRAEQEGRAAAAANALSRARELHEDAARFLTAKSPAETISVALARTARALRSDAQPLGVIVSEMTIEGAGTAFDAVDISAVAKPLPIAAEVKRISVLVKGTYSRLAGLREYVARAASGQAALATFAADGSRFEVTIHVYGI